MQAARLYRDRTTPANAVGVTVAQQKKDRSEERPFQLANSGRYDNC